VSGSDRTQQAEREAQVNLIRRFREGDEEAFRELLERYGDVVAHRIQRMLPRAMRRRVTVQDVLQDACLAAYQHRDRFESEEVDGFRRWLLGIVDHKVKDAVRFHVGAARRSLEREVTRSRRPDTAAMRGGALSPSRMAIDTEQQDRVRDAMAGLPPDYQEVLRLTRHENLSLREAAVRMGRSREATKKIYTRSLAKLRAMLDTDLDKPDDQ
jgi:RNA polymerase sigma-70 factor (ECF subfamily)